jgi:hypothetical protein
MMAAVAFLLSCGGGMMKNPPSEDPTDAGPGCSMVGTWSGNYACATLGGWPVSWQFSDDGGATLSQGWPPADAISQQWSVSQRTLNFTELGNPSCATQADYQVGFDGGCGIVTFTMKTDSCPVRSECLDGLSLSR